jgi:hypothetical protein
MAINSAQGIASLYRGNPQPLQQSIQKEQQAKPGLPPDLQKMLALQIVNNEKDAAAAQAAMQQLKQMSGPTGQMPTVMASLQQQAQQKLQTQQQQARQQAEQRGLPAGMMGVQGEPPQPKMQPKAQGIDQLPAEFEMAEGGIVAFAGPSGSSVPKPDEEESLSKYADAPVLAAEAAALGVSVAAYKQAADLAARLGTSVGEVLKVTAKDAGKTVAGTAKAGLKGLVSAPAQVVLAGGVPATQFAGDVIRSASPEQRKDFYENPMMGAMSGDTGLAAAIMNESKPAQEVKKATAAAARPAPTYSPEDQSAAETARLQRQKTLPQAPAQVKPVAAPKPSAEEAQIDKLLANVQGGAARPAGGGPRPPAQPAGLPEALAQKQDPRLEKLMNLDPEAERKRVTAEREKLAPDDTWTKKLMAEYEQQKQALAPKQGFEGLAELFADISRAGADPRTRGRGSFASGAAGAALNAERAAANKQQQFEYTKQMMELGQKSDEAKRVFKLETSKAGEDAYKNAYTLAMDAFKEKGQNDRNAATNATQMATTAMHVAESARGHTLTAQSQLLNLKLAEKRADKDASALQLKALSETAKELGALLKDPSFAMTDEGKRTTAMIQSIAAEVAKRGGVDLGQAGFSSAPSTNVRPPIK